jgi:hypothetical protein
MDQSIPTRQVIQQAKEALSLWEGLLHRTEEALASEERFWYLLEVIRTKCKWTFTQETQCPGFLY